VSPILVRPVREQLEHDRVIRLLQAKYKRRFQVGVNLGAERIAPAGVGASAQYPDLVLASTERGHRLQAVVEVETGESVNHLEALAEWVPFAKLRGAFHLYVPSNMIDVARRLCEENGIHVAELWSYHAVADDVRFTIVHRTREAAAQPRTAKAAPRQRPQSSAKRPAARRAKPARRPVKARKRK
jgi:hypothetical protein